MLVSSENTLNDDKTEQLNRVMQLVAQGDQGAFEALYDMVGGVVFGTALRVLRNRALAEEAAQEALVAVWKTAPNWDRAKGSAITYILTVTRRKAIDRVRSEESRRRREERISAGNYEPPLDSSAEQVIADDEASALRRRLNELPQKQRAVIELAFSAGRTHIQIAEELAVPLGTVKSRMRDGLLRLRELTEAGS